MSETPYEIIVAPYQVYVGPHGETFPDVSITPAGNWVLLGTNGDKNMEGAGVTAQHPQTINLHRVYGTTAPVKATRSSEDLIFGFTLLDLTSEEYARILNENTVTPTAAGGATAGFDTIDLLRGLNVTQRAWLIRGDDASPKGTAWGVQYELPKGIVSSSPSVVFGKTDPAGLTFEVTGLFDSAEAAGEELGRLVIQTADPTG